MPSGKKKTKSVALQSEELMWPEKEQCQMCTVMLAVLNILLGPKLLISGIDEEETGKGIHLYG